MKEKELRENAECNICSEKIGASGPLFWRVTVERFGLDGMAISRHQGLTMMLGGSAELAAAMGTDEDLAHRLMKKLTLTVCASCEDKEISVSRLSEYEGQS